MTDQAFAFDNVSVHAGGRRVLDIDSLKGPRGSLTAIIGPNGAGKTTLIRCLLGMQPHVRGRVAVLGRPLDQMGWRALAALRRRIGYVPQLLPSSSEIPLTVREVVAIGRTGIAGLLNPLRRQDWRMVDQWIEQVGLTSLRGRGFGEISGGEQRKTLIARAMVQEPGLLLLDEPTANLDLGWRERIVEIIAELYQSRKPTIVLVCHELEVLPACCDRVLLLKSGRIAADGSPGEVLSTQTVTSLYGPGLGVLQTAGRFAVVPREMGRA